MLCAVNTIRASARTLAGSRFMASLNVRRVGGDELRVVEPALDKRDVDVAAVIAQRLLGRRDVLAILLAARIGVMGRSDETDGAANAIRMHPLQRVRQIRVPVAHANVDRQRVTHGNQARAKAVRLPLRQLGQWGNAVEELVVMRDLFDPLRRDASSAQDVCEKRADIVAALRTTESDDAVRRRTPKWKTTSSFASAFLRFSATALAAFWSASPSAASNDGPWPGMPLSAECWRAIAA